MKPDPDAGFSAAAQVNPSVPKLGQQCVPDDRFPQFDSSRDRHHHQAYVTEVARSRESIVMIVITIIIVKMITVPGSDSW